MMSARRVTVPGPPVEDGWVAPVRADGAGEFDYFECVEGSPYGPHLYLWHDEEGTIDGVR